MFPEGFESPEDRPDQVNDKIREYLAAGVDRIWFVNPRLSELFQA